MEELIKETGKKAKHTIRPRQTQKDNDREMDECLERLKVWRVENLMSPTGMDRFARCHEAGETKKF